MRRSRRLVVDQVEVGLDGFEVALGAAVLEEDQGARSGVGVLAVSEDVNDEVAVVSDETAGGFGGHYQSKRSALSYRAIQAKWK